MRISFEGVPAKDVKSFPDNAVTLGIKLNVELIELAGINKEQEDLQTVGLIPPSSIPLFP